VLFGKEGDYYKDKFRVLDRRMMSLYASREDAEADIEADKVAMTAKEDHYARLLAQRKESS
jgi:hypothetical protein